MTHWDYFNWPEILREAKMRHANAMNSSAKSITSEMLTLEYWTAWCAHANAESVRCNYPNCDGGPATGYCHDACRVALGH